MTRLLRLFCLTLAVAFMASMSLHGSADARDQVEHMVDEIAAVHGVEVSGHAHPDCGQEAAETGETAPGHHHHSGDSHSFALGDRTGGPMAASRATLALAWSQHRLPDGLLGDGPDQPPKRTLTLA